MRKHLFIWIMVFACSVFANDNPYNIPDPIRPLWDSLTTKQKIAQMIMVYLSKPDVIVKNEFGAVLVMKNHLSDPIAYKKKVTESNARLNIPLLVATDQEGGKVNRIGGISEKWQNAPSAKAMRGMSADSVEAIAESIGQELFDLGINLNLAPVLDPAKDYKGKATFMEESNRSWEKDSASVDKVRAFVRGMKKSNVFCVSKHFPGYDSWTNSDHQIAFSATPEESIRKNVNFFAQLSNDIPFTMMSSVRFRQISDKPAVFEPAIIQMAREMSPDVVILTDDLWGVSLRAWISGKEKVSGTNYPKKDFEKLVLTALLAGNDMFMITFPAKAEEMIEFLEANAKTNETIMNRIDESAARILKMKYKAGILKAKE